MAKRSREDFEPSSPTSSGTIGEPEAPARTVVHPTVLDGPAPSPKILHLDKESGEATQVTEMRCSLPPHRGTLTFASYEEYDVHYAKTHVNRCLECKKNFPTEHFLNLHIEENHDSLVSVRRERGERTVNTTLHFRHIHMLICFALNSIHALSKTVIENAPLHKRGVCTLSTNTCSPRITTSMW